MPSSAEPRAEAPRPSSTKLSVEPLSAKPSVELSTPLSVEPRSFNSELSTKSTSAKLVIEYLPRLLIAEQSRPLSAEPRSSTSTKPSDEVWSAKPSAEYRSCAELSVEPPGATLSSAWARPSSAELGGELPRSSSVELS